jgi:putative endonuclease
MSVPTKSPTPRAILGKTGENLAADFLESLGYEIRGRNIRLSRDEIDILAFDPVDKTLVFAEVKTRKTFSREFSPHMSAGFRKCEKLRRSARRWVAEHQYNGGYRLDLVCVAGGKVIDHLKELSWE